MAFAKQVGVIENVDGFRGIPFVLDAQTKIVPRELAMNHAVRHVADNEGYSENESITNTTFEDSNNKNGDIDDDNKDDVEDTDTASVYSEAFRMTTQTITPRKKIENIKKISTLHVVCDDNRNSEFQLFTGGDFGLYSESEVDIDFTDTDADEYNSEAYRVSFTHNIGDESADAISTARSQKHISVLNPHQCTLSHEKISEQIHTKLNSTVMLDQKGKRNSSNFSLGRDNTVTGHENHLTLVRNGQRALEDGKYDVARANLTKALDLQIQIVGKNHVDAAAMHEVLGDISSQLSDYDYSTAHYSESIRVLRIVNKDGNAKLDILRLLEKEGNLHFRFEQKDLALKSLTDALIIQQERIESQTSARKLGQVDTDAIERSKINAILLSYRIGQIHFLKGEFDLSLSIFTEILESELLPKALAHNKEEIAVILSRSAFIHFKKVQYDESLAKYTKAFSMMSFNPQNFRETLEATNNIAIIHCKRGGYNVAISWYLDVLTKVKAEFGLYHAEVVNLLRKVGVLTIKIGDYQTCLEYFSTELEVRTEIGSRPCDIIFTKRCLGDIHRRLKNYDESLRYFTEAIDQQQRMGRSKTLASLFNAMGVLQINKGNVDDALQYFENAHDVLKEIEGNNDLSTATTLQNKGNAYYAKESFDKAIISYRSSMRLLKKALGDDHEEVLGSLSNIGKAYFGKSLFDEAMQIFELVLQKHKQKSNPEMNSLEISSTINSIAGIHLKRGSYSESVMCYKCSITMKELILDSEDIDCLETKRNLAWARFKQARYTDALSILNRVLAVLKTKHSDNELDLIITLEMIASVFFKKRAYRKAKLNYEEVLNMKLVQFGENHRQYVSTLHNIALVHGEEGNLDNALELLTDVLQKKTILLGNKHPEVGKTQSDLAHLHFIRHEPDQAKLNFSIALKIFVDAKFPKNHTYMQELNIRQSEVEKAGDVPLICVC